MYGYQSTDRQETVLSLSINSPLTNCAIFRCRFAWSGSFPLDRGGQAINVNGWWRVYGYRASHQRLYVHVPRTIETADAGVPVRPGIRYKYGPASSPYIALLLADCKPEKFTRVRRALHIQPSCTSHNSVKSPPKYGKVYHLISLDQT